MKARKAPRAAAKQHGPEPVLADPDQGGSKRIRGSTQGSCAHLRFRGQGGGGLYVTPPQPLSSQTSHTHNNRQLRPLRVSSHTDVLRPHLSRRDRAFATAEVVRSQRWGVGGSPPVPPPPCPVPFFFPVRQKNLKNPSRGGAEPQSV